MPALEDIEKFKKQVQSLSRENEIRQAMGLPPEEISAPESQLTDDLADLLGGMPTTETVPSESPDDLDSLLDKNFPEEAPEAEALEDYSAPTGEEDMLAGIFDQATDTTEATDMPSLDDLLGPGKPVSEPAEELEPGSATDLPEDLFEPPAELDEAEVSQEFEAMEPLPDFDLPEAAEAADLSGDALAMSNLDDLLAGGDAGVAQERPASTEGVNPEELSDEFFATPGEELYQVGSPSGEDDYVFGDGSSDADFPELAGFAATKEEDVEAFDAMGEADEFQLGDFESQFGITADDHEDSDLLNPAQSVDQDIEAAQRTLSLSEEEFSALQVTLQQQPLNLKIAIEELIGEKEIVFDDLDKVVGLLVSGATTKSIASVVGKILGRKIQIPAGFEKGTGEALQERQASLWFNLRNVMFPILRVSLIVSVFLGILVVLGWNYLVKPLRAQDLYNRGLEQIKQNNGELADDLFAQAYYYWPAQDRFFQYAEAFMDTGDYDRARRKYLELLKPTIRPFNDEAKKLLDDQFGEKLGPLPDGLSEQKLQERLAEKKRTADAFYAVVVHLLSGRLETGDGIQGAVLFTNPNTKALLDLSNFETYYGFDGKDREAHFRRADNVLTPLFETDVYHKEALLRKGDNFLEWAASVSSYDRYNDANSAFSSYMQKYGADAPITWRFVKLFILTDNEKEILNLKHRILIDTKLATDGEVMAQLAKWLLDRENAREEKEKEPQVRLKTLEDEYGIPSKASTETAKGDQGSASSNLNIKREEGGAAANAESKPIEIKPPFKYPYSSQLFRPLYIEDLDKLLSRAMDTQKELPELHYQISRYFRRVRNSEDERKALAAADTYFQRLEPRKLRLNGRPAMRIQNLNRIGEVFAQGGQPLQAEKYFLEAQRFFQLAQTQKLVKLDRDSASIFRNLGNLYYEQAPGATESAKLGSWDQALKLYLQAEEGKLEDFAVSFRKGVIYYEKKDFSSAITEFFELEKDPRFRSDWNLLYAMGNALFRNGNYFAAEGYYRNLLELLKEKRSHILNLDVTGRKSHRAIVQRIFETENNLAAAIYRGTNGFKSGTREFREALAYLTEAQGMATVLGMELFESPKELDLTAVDDKKLKEIRDEQVARIQKTRKERGLVEANLQLLSLLEITKGSKRNDLLQELEIFARIPLNIDQTDSP